MLGNFIDLNNLRRYYPIVRQVFVVTTSLVILGSSCGPTKKKKRRSLYIENPPEEVFQEEENVDQLPEANPTNDYDSYYKDEVNNEEVPSGTEVSEPFEEAEESEDTKPTSNEEYYSEEDDDILKEETEEETLAEDEAIDFDKLYKELEEAELEEQRSSVDNSNIVLDKRPLRASHAGTGFLNFYKKNYATIATETKKFYPQGSTYGCAAYASTALKLAGYNVKQVTVTNQLEGEILRMKWKRVNILFLQKGDVVFTTKETSNLPGTYSHVFIHGGYTGPLRRYSRATDNQGVSYERNLYFKKGGKSKAIFAYRPRKLN